METRVKIDLTKTNQETTSDYAQLEAVEESNIEAVHRELNALLNDFIKSTAALVCYTEGWDELSDSEDDELSTIVDKSYADLSAVLEDVYRPSGVGNFYDFIFHEVKKIVKNRTKYYEFEIEYSGRVHCYVQAHSEEEAREYLDRRCNIHDDIIAEDDDTDIDSIDCVGEDYDTPYYGTVLSALE